MDGQSSEGTKGYLVLPKHTQPFPSPDHLCVAGEARGASIYLAGIVSRPLRQKEACRDCVGILGGEGRPCQEPTLGLDGMEPNAIML